MMNSAAGIVHLLRGARRFLLLCGLVLPSLLLLSSCVVKTIRHGRATRSYVSNLGSDPKGVLEMGPILGHAGSDYFTVSCRTGEDARLTVYVGGRRVVSDAEEYHNVTVPGLPSRPVHTYRVEVQELEGKRRQKSFGPFNVSTVPSRAPFRFVAYGDPQAAGGVWRRVADAMRAERPAFALSLGDMVWTGADKWEWRDGTFAQARPFFASVPQYIVRGNHDVGGEKWFNLFASPSGTGNWTQVFGPVRIVGVDISSRWDPDDPPYQWLNSVLARAREPFLFLAVHPPPYTSTFHGDEEDEHVEHGLTRLSRSVMLPLMQRYGGTAILSGHAHSYERNELPGGLTCIVSGGAGAKLYRRSAKASNPYSKRFARAHHYLVFEVEPQRVTVKAVDLAGRILDQRRWGPRQASHRPSVR
ncbi:MAG: metallophosphoesterase family protein [Planctomycetota bacterium]|jgi:hypothetical protein